MLVHVARAVTLLVTGSLVTLLSSACAQDYVVSGTNPSASAAPAGPLSGPLVVFAAAPLSDALQDAKGKLASTDPKLALNFTFSDGPGLVKQIQQNTAADVFAGTDQADMQQLVAANLVELPSIFARDKLQITVSTGNPKKITKLADLARPDVKVALIDAGVATGKYTKVALDRQKLVVKPAAAPADAKAALLAVTSGQADATVVYKTDMGLATGGAVMGIAIPDDENVVALCRIAVLKAAHNRAAAQAFADYLVNGGGQAVVTAHGYLPP
jgi:molybdate transport system substrate-binding protein